MKEIDQLSKQKEVLGQTGIEKPAEVEFAGNGLGRKGNVLLHTVERVSRCMEGSDFLRWERLLNGWHKHIMGWGENSDWVNFFKDQSIEMQEGAMPDMAFGSDSQGNDLTGKWLHSIRKDLW